jgi:hypothetical protein
VLSDGQALDDDLLSLDVGNSAVRNELDRRGVDGK